ncbi:MAG: c-type cytochrome [Chloroflexi bacterium]|nr:c-type cytochrome [Chloroflexota bacterium]
MKLRRGLQVSLLLLFVIIVAACAQRAVPDGELEAARGQYSPEVKNGAWLYVDFGCVRCHGLGGRGRDLLPASGPSLVSAEFKKTFPKGAEFDGALLQMIKNGAIIEKDGVASMPAWNSILSDEEIGDIVAYIRAGLPNLNVPVSGTRTGQEIYTSFACTKCHGPLGTGGIRNQAASSPSHQIIPKIGGPGFKQKFGSREMVRSVVLHGRLVDQGRPGVVYMPAWGKIGTAAEIDILVEYIWNSSGE